MSFISSTSIKAMVRMLAIRPNITHEPIITGISQIMLSPYYLSSSLFMLNAIITMQAMASVMVVTAKAIRKLIIIFDHLGE